MRYHVLATDYDGTLAHDGKVDDATHAALERLRQSRRKLILVTGRRLEDLRALFERFDFFDRIVAEKGALIYYPASREERLLGEAPPPQFSEKLRAAGASGDNGRVIVATWEPYETAALAALRELGLEHQIIFNKGAVMVLPPGVYYASVLRAALDDLGLSAHNAVAGGDAENDLALRDLCEFVVAVANALPSVKEAADWTTAGDHGAGVGELIDQLIADDLRRFEGQSARRSVALGLREDASEDKVSLYASNILLAGSSGSGKSTLSTGFMERLAQQNYQFCCIDHEGDYSTLRNTVDEAHHLWPLEWEAGRLVVPDAVHGMMFITLHPDHLAPALTKHVNVVIAIGAEPAERYAEFQRACDCEIELPSEELEQGDAWVWRR